MRSFAHTTRTTLFVSVVALALVAALAPAARAQDAAPAAEMPELPELDFSFGAGYTVVSDYIWRGMNLSEYDGEGQEKLNHQVDLSVSLNTEVGKFTAGAWFEFYEAQHDMDPDSNCALQEVDYTLKYENIWGYLTYGAGVIWYTLPHVSGDAQTTNEVFVTATLDDTCLFGMPIFTPTATWYVDMDQSKGNGWLDLGISHGFEMPGLESLVITPSMTLSFDNQYTDQTKNRVGALLYGLKAVYDLGGIMPDGVDMSVGAFVNYSQALESDDVLNDEFFGGVTLGLGF